MLLGLWQLCFMRLLGGWLLGSWLHRDACHALWLPGVQIVLALCTSWPFQRQACLKRPAMYDVCSSTTATARPLPRL